MCESFCVLRPFEQRVGESKAYVSLHCNISPRRAKCATYGTLWYFRWSVHTTHTNTFSVFYAEGIAKVQRRRVDEWMNEWMKKKPIKGHGSFVTGYENCSRDKSTTWKKKERERYTERKILTFTKQQNASKSKWLDGNSAINATAIQTQLFSARVFFIFPLCHFVQLIIKKMKVSRCTEQNNKRLIKLAMLDRHAELGRVDL